MSWRSEIEVVEPILDGRAGQDEEKAAVQAAQRRGGLGAKVFCALRFVEDDDIRAEPREGAEVAPEQLIVDDEIRRIGFQRRLSLRCATTDDDRRAGQCSARSRAPTAPSATRA